MTHHHTAPAAAPAEAAPVLPPALGHLIRRGDRVLAIGPGPLAVALAERTACQVVSVHATLGDVEAVRAALGPHGRAVVTVDAQLGDLSAGRPESGPYNVIVLTTGISGISPRWIRQLAPRGAIVAPVALGGLHPWLVAGTDRYDRQWYGALVGVDEPGPDAAASADERPVPQFAAQWAGVVPPRLTRSEYMDLWLWLASRDDRITAATAAGTSWGPGPALVAGASVVYVLPKGLWVSDTGPATLALAQDLADEIVQWSLHRPELADLTCRLAPPPGAGPDAPWLPEEWATGRPLALPR
ncbi:hypothetical protein ACWCXH_33730 [Kitasatospora sp. NPDC001660]